MANRSLISAVPKFLKLSPLVAQRIPGSLRVLVTNATNPIQGTICEDAHKPVNGEVRDNAEKAVEANRGIVCAATSQVAEKADEIGDKAKQVAQDAWNSAKETTQKAKDTIVSTTKETKNNIKDNAKTVERAMNTRNH